ncbi:hypothetical protein HKBW3S03_00660 [Candidatus Hakubella thermalkaliphila]|uniref:Uncharacterized protein n=1 Tax=Candidatus Hakubella thermalkaliphila TaxID=2754717 RepID=A0A6V8PA21_9ACTN|nr:hypothetical protein [Candidatus Hakubella thermalkaliphila]GFP19156.1 hypothetical protein HKBW3S03_00660 [Candidatus Hakubella thermalkaliphila]GFP23727.1 hypothetical protein HKBW3S09_01192 [Candidatus Hakubella thermalkaliphila]GFP29535.1 hypothetical protein HKBW3S34_00455 [Candidatus Hakubella thermalkaliphila]GFP39594.1 hypothetical protein HKBW3S47_01292 [Candidatus Hakubella thermalkaliphila]GFP43412.1 hypothetical protein HKBW3C_02542 [Candidatus Hakubella thermalkaliphila]
MSFSRCGTGKNTHTKSERYQKSNLMQFDPLIFPDEEGAEQALSLLRDYVAEKVQLYAPSLIDYEVLNGALVALRKGRLEREH